MEKTAGSGGLVIARRGLRISVAAVLAITALGGCKNDLSGKISGSPAKPAAPSSKAAANTSAPKVPAPLPTAGIAAHPCDALSTTQMRTLGLAPPGRTRNSVTGHPETCQWQGAVYDFNAAFIDVPYPYGHGLADLYAVRNRFGYFEPTQVDGYPGFFGQAVDDRKNGNCGVIFGLTDQFAVSVSVELSVGVNKTHPCDSASKIGAAVIEHLKGAA
jgi:hypothetical protein